MSQDYKIVSVEDRREWVGKHGPMVSYDLHVEGVPDKVELAQKPQTAAPAPGNVVFGHVEDGPFGKRLKKDQRNPGGAARNGGGGFQPRPEDPDRQARIVRQHSVEMAIRALELGATWGCVAKPADTKELLERIRWLATWFDDDVETTVANARLAKTQTDGSGANNW